MSMPLSQCFPCLPLAKCSCENLIKSKACYAVGKHCCLDGAKLCCCQLENSPAVHFDPESGHSNVMRCSCNFVINNQEMNDNVRPDSGSTGVIEADVEKCSMGPVNQCQNDQRLETCSLHMWCHRYPYQLTDSISSWQKQHLLQLQHQKSQILEKQLVSFDTGSFSQLQIHDDSELINMLTHQVNELTAKLYNMHVKVECYEYALKQLHSQLYQANQALSAENGTDEGVGSECPSLNQSSVLDLPLAVEYFNHDDFGGDQICEPESENREVAAFVISDSNRQTDGTSADPMEKVVCSSNGLSQQTDGESVKWIQQTGITHAPSVAEDITATQTWANSEGKVQRTNGLLDGPLNMKNGTTSIVAAASICASCHKELTKGRTDENLHTMREALKQLSNNYDKLLSRNFGLEFELKKASKEINKHKSVNQLYKELFACYDLLRDVVDILQQHRHPNNELVDVVETLKARTTSKTSSQTDLRLCDVVLLRQYIEAFYQKTQLYFGTLCQVIV